MVVHIIRVLLLWLQIIIIFSDIILFFISQIVFRCLSFITILKIIVVLWHLLQELVLLAVRWLVRSYHHTPLLGYGGHLVDRLRRSLGGPAEV